MTFLDGTVSYEARTHKIELLESITNAALRTGPEMVLALNKAPNITTDLDPKCSAGWGPTRGVVNPRLGAPPRTTNV
jgi:hypothetical protein